MNSLNNIEEKNMCKLFFIALLMFGLMSSAYTNEVKVKDDLPNGKPVAGHDSGFWMYGTVVKLGATNSNPAIVIRTDSGNEHTYTISCKNNSQILQLATQAVASNLQVQVYVYDNYYTPYITALYILAGNNPPMR